MTCTCPQPRWLDREQQRLAERLAESRLKRRLKKLAGEPISPDAVARIVAALFQQDTLQPESGVTA
jgi:hypothetical protein